MWSSPPTYAAEATPRTELSEAFPQLGPAQAPSTPKGPVATRREEEERNMRQHHTELIKFCLDHQMDTLNKQSISRLPTWSHCGKPDSRPLVPEITFCWALEGAAETWAPCHTMCSYNSHSCHHGFCIANRPIECFACRISLMSHASTRPGTV